MVLKNYAPRLVSGLCDCYIHVCEAEGCERGLPWHIADFAYAREEFVIYCPDHLELAGEDFALLRVKGAESVHEGVWAVYGPCVGPGCGNHPNLIDEKYEWIRGCRYLEPRRSKKNELKFDPRALEEFLREAKRKASAWRARQQST